MRLSALGLLVLVGGTALAQPAPAPGDTPPADHPPEVPDGPHPPPVPQDEPPPPPPGAGTAPAQTPAPTPIAVPAPVPPAPSKKRTATEARLAAASICAARSPDCDWIATFSSLERVSIMRTLAELGLAPEPAPWGKTIGTIRIHNEDVFAEKNWLRFFNLFHVTTRERAIRRELTVREGELWDDDRVGESARIVKDPLYTSVVALVPVKSAEAGKVDLLVVTRDIWSLRLNTKWDVVDGSLTGFQTSLSENNFLGLRKTVAYGFNMDQGAIATGPLYIDKNFLGQHIDLRIRVDKILTRKSLDVITGDSQSGLMRVPTGDPGGLQDASKLRSEGDSATISLNKTLWSLASTWGAGASLSYRNSISRSYLFTGLRAYDDPRTPEVDVLPYEYRMKTWSTRASATRQWGDEFKNVIEAGYGVTSQHPSLLNTPLFEAAGTPLLDAFRHDVFPRDEVTSGPFVEYSLYQTRFATLRNVDTYELAEDLRYGPNLTVGLSQTFKSAGSTYRFTRPSLSAGWSEPLGRDGYARISAGGQLRIQDGRTVDNTATAQLRVVTPTLTYLRLLAQVHTETRWHDESNAFYTLGSDNGLRAYGISQFYGDRRIGAQLEARSVPYPFWVIRVGGVLFYDGGGSADTFRQMRFLHDVGFGLRMLIPQSSRELFRFDLAFPLTSADSVQAGHPRFIAGFDSYF